MDLIVILVYVVPAILILAWYLHVRNKREEASIKAAEEAISASMTEPPSLHPVIDPDICISSAACVAACPEGDVLGLVDGAGRLIHGAECIGHGRCAAECPVDAIRSSGGG